VSETVIDGRTVEYLVSGNGRDAIVLCAASWWPLDPWRLAGIPELSDCYQTVAFNARGLGASSGSDLASYDVDLFAADALALLDRLGIERCAIVGFTIGAAIALRIARRVPDRVWALVLGAVSPGAPPDSESPRRVVEADIAERGYRGHIEHHALHPGVAFTAETFAQRPDRPRLLADALWAGAASEAEFMKHVDARRGYSAFDGAGDVAAPALLLVGDGEGKNRSEATRKLAGLLPHAEFAVLSGTGHMVFWEDPPAVWTRVRAFLDANAPAC
jgi:3-oxoadipate enol-lactonase